MSKICGCSDTVFTLIEVANPETENPKHTTYNFNYSQIFTLRITKHTNISTVYIGNTHLSIVHLFIDIFGYRTIEHQRLKDVEIVICY